MPCNQSDTCALTSYISLAFFVYGFKIINFFSIVLGLQLRSIEEPAGGAGAGMPAPTCYDSECARTEAWLDENQEFVHDYFLR